MPQNHKNLIHASALGEFQFSFKARDSALVQNQRETRNGGGHTSSITSPAHLSIWSVGSFESLQNSKFGWKSVKVLETQW